MKPKITCEWPPAWLVNTTTNERVVLLLGVRSGVISRTVRVRNCHNEKRNRWALSQADFDRVVLRPGEFVIGIAHSHPEGGRPSLDDRRGLKPGWIGAVYDCEAGRIWWYNAKTP